jgi:hypothetical protein
MLLEMDRKERTEKAKTDLLKQVVKSSYPIVPVGGQHCGIPKGICLSLKDLEIEITINCLGSQHRNLELAVTLMELAIEEYLN